MCAARRPLAGYNADEGRWPRAPGARPGPAANIPGTPGRPGPVGWRPPPKAESDRPQSTGQPRAPLARSEPEGGARGGATSQQSPTTTPTPTRISACSIVAGRASHSLVSCGQATDGSYCALEAACARRWPELPLAATGSCIRQINSASALLQGTYIRCTVLAPARYVEQAHPSRTRPKLDRQLHWSARGDGLAIAIAGIQRHLQRVTRRSVKCQAQAFGAEVPSVKGAAGKVCAKQHRVRRAPSRTTELKLLSPSAPSASKVSSPGPIMLGSSAATIELDRFIQLDRRSAAAVCAVMTSSIGTNQT